jgi:membrane-associated phospholipid phosphatase
MNIRSLFHHLYKLPGSTFLIGYLIFFPAVSVFVMLYSKEAIHMVMNSWHTTFLDRLMKYWTMLGDGIVLTVIVLILLLVSLRHFFTGLSALVFGGMGAQLFKRLFFSEFPRPLKYFELIGSDYPLYLVPGVEFHSWYSFPSGHTAAAFAVFYILALMTRSQLAQAVFFLLALGVGFSRIYLSQHFLMDVAGGSLLGMAGGWFAWRWFRQYEADWIDRPLQRLSRR